MNKIKIIYDAARKMKARNSIKGAVKVDGLKDQKAILCFNSAFERNNQDGQMNGKTIIEVDNEGKKMKLENTINVQGEGFCGHHGFFRHMHSFHKHHHDAHTKGFKEGLGRITAVLGVLSSIKIEEKEDKSAVLSLESKNMPGDIKSSICEMIKHEHEHHNHMDGNHQHKMFMKEFHDMENKDFTLNVFINKDSEIEKATLDVNGQKEDEKNEKHQMKLSAELCFQW